MINILKTALALRMILVVQAADAKTTASLAIVDKVWAIVQSTFLTAHEAFRAGKSPHTPAEWAAIETSYLKAADQFVRATANAHAALESNAFLVGSIMIRVNEEEKGAILTWIDTADKTPPDPIVDQLNNAMGIVGMMVPFEKAADALDAMHQEDLRKVATPAEKTTGLLGQDEWSDERLCGEGRNGPLN